MLRICGYEYTVDASNTKVALGIALGRACPDEQRIMLACDQSPECKQSTLIHEVIEAMNIHLAMALDEAAIRRLEAAWYTFLTENGVDLEALVQRGLMP